MVAMLASMFVVGTPASAATGAYNAWSAEITPNLMTTENMLAAVDIVDLAVAGDGTTIYAATGSYVGKLYKSLNSGATWTAVATLPTGIGTTITKVVVAPDVADGSYLGIIADGNEVYFSADGGTTWAAAPAVAATTTLYAIDISRLVGSTRTIAVGGKSAGTAAVPAVAATATITIPAACALDTTLNIDGAAITLVAGDSATAIATKIATAVTASGTLTTAASAAAVVTFTARVAGAAANGLLPMADATYSTGTVPAVTLAGGVTAVTAVTAVAQVDTVTPVPANTQTYNLRIAVGATNYDFSYTAGSPATAAEIVSAFVALVNASAVPVTASGAATLILTADVAGTPFTTTSSGPGVLTIVHTTANVVGVTAVAAVAATGTSTIPAGVDAVADTALNIDGAAITLVAGDSATAIATKIAAAVTTSGTLTTATSAAAVVTFTARVAGAAANGSLPMTDATYSGGTVPAITLAGGAAAQGAVDLATVEYLEIGGLFGGSWVDATVTVAGGWTATNFGPSAAALALKFSPNFAGDRALAVVTGPATTAAAGDSLTVKLQVANFYTKFWNLGILGYTGWGTGLTIDTVTTGNVVQAASLALDPNYLGQSASSRLLYVGLATSDTATPGGVYRFTDTTKAVLLATTKIQSVALNAAADKLVAGASASNYVYRLASPATALSTGVLSSSSFKSPAGPATTNVVATWMGTSVIAGTTGTESAFSVSKDDGKSFNDISLVDTTISMKDFAVSADGTKVYLVTTYGSYTSLWKKVTAWERVLVLASNADFLVRAAPENFDVAYLAQRTTPFQIYYTNDGGATSWLPRYFASAITDMALESASVVYVLSTTTVSKSIDGGLIWNGSLTATAIKAGFTGATLTLVSAGNLLVGSTDSRVAYSTDGNVSWTVPVPVVTAVALPSGTAFATADKLSSGGYIYMATSSATSNVYRWNIGVSTSWTAMRSTATVGTATGIAYSNGVLYVTCCPSTSTTLYRTLYPTTTTSDTYWSGLTASTTGINTAMAFTDTPQALQVAPAGKLWAIDTDSSQMLETYIEYLTYGPTLVAPVTGSEQPIDIATGRAQPIIFQFKQLVAALAYQLQIATDITFNAPVFDSTAQTDLTLVAVKNWIIGPNAAGGQYNATFEFLPDITYYWRVRAAVGYSPDSPWSVVYSFKMGGIAVAGVTSPAKGAYNVPITPSFVWSEAKGAVLYELEVSTDSTFETTDLTATPDKAYYQTADADALAYDTTYYWRVRVATTGTWVFGVFTTMAEPTTPAPPYTIAPTVTTTLPAIETNVPIIPTWMLWIIIAIGAVLVIALLVLIVRTRRAA
jgi:hypothetical protein